MGCHTWFYKRCDRTIEEAREIALSILKEYIVLCENIILDKNYHDRDWLDFDVIGGTNDDTRRREIKISERKIQIIKKGLCNSAVYNMEPTLNVLIGEKFYIESDRHDIFRTNGYPDTRLFSLEETLVYINDPKTNCFHNGEVSIKALEDFWIDHPNGLIEFG